VPSADAALLNEHQRRHLGITLGQIQQLLHEITALLQAPPRDGLVLEEDDIPAEFARRAPQAIAQLEAEIARLGQRFELPSRARSRFRWVRSVLSISIDNVEDSRAARLRAYGTVNSELAPVLDPELRALQGQLRALLFLLDSGPEYV
jgi:hypothetical protein